MFKEMTDEELLDFCEDNFCEYKICQVLGCEDNCKEEDCPLCQLFDRFKKNAAIVPDTNVGHKSEWISVDERLPEEGKNVLCVEGNKMMIAFMEKVEDCGTFVPVFWDWVAYDRDDTWNEVCPTHWMPLPEPPMMKGGAE